MNIAVSMTKANQLEQKNKHEEAAKVYGDILAKFPKNTRAQAALNRLRESSQRDLNPSLEAQQKLTAAFEANDYAKAASACAALLNNHRKSHFLWNMLGKCHLEEGNLDEAATCLNKACELNPKDPSTFSSMADVHRAQGHIDNALALFDKALSLDDSHLNALNNKANTLIDLGRLNEAAPLLNKAAKLAPENPVVLFNYSNVLLKTGKTLEAKALLEQATELAPHLTGAQYNLAQLQSRDGDTEAAIQRFETMLEDNPGDDCTRADKFHAQAQLNDWSWIEDYQQARRQLGLTGKACAPFAALTFEDNPDLLRLRIQAHANTALPKVEPAKPLPADLMGSDRPERLRIGYFSSDFHDHATMRQMAGLFEAHDQSRFDIIAYSYDSTPEDAMRSRIGKAVSSFVDISQLSDGEAAKLVVKDGLDIAIDLKGFTGTSRTTLFAHRLAPLHMSYLGFPGTLGTTAMDYFVGDHVTCPAGSERYFEEHLIRLPHSFQVNDDKRTLSGQQFTRKDCGLPETGFVFCSFNSSYKITPAEFDIWMRLLDQVENSVLWLLECSETAKAHLRQEATRRGQDPERLIFAPRIAQEEHLARHPVADLFLDTFTVNAQTAASDALWAGLPVLTLPGRQFASRVGASQLSALGLPELIAKSAADYEARALELASDLDALASLRSTLQRNRLSAPLFDTKGFTRELEQGFDMAHARYLQGLPPAHLEVRDPPALEAEFPLAALSPSPAEAINPAP
ncbi:tetratricopeptide repeat protein [Pseudophaeobacter sp.]|uniref:O-linked N-acetylglucosamine transferase, SPINDLY family protein n=1 Tax=Pseudophaeobacter sp. TaxID=1971739 RepID=UPI00329754BD